MRVMERMQRKPIYAESPHAASIGSKIMEVFITASRQRHDQVPFAPHVNIAR